MEHSTRETEISNNLELLKEKYKNLSPVEKEALQNILFTIEAKRTFNLEGTATSLEQMGFAKENSNPETETKEEYKAINIKTIFKKIWHQNLNNQKQPLTVQDITEIWRGLKLFNNDKNKNNTRDQIPLKSNQTFIWKENKKIYFLKPDNIANELGWLVKFFNNPNLSEVKKYSKLAVCWILHHWFEAIHPFSDGNGRAGRLLISLFLSRNNLWIKDWICPLSFQIYQKRLKYLTSLNFSSNQQSQDNDTESIWKQKNYDNNKNYFSNLEYKETGLMEYLKTMDYFLLNTITKITKVIPKYQKQKIKVKQEIESFCSLPTTHNNFFFQKHSNKLNLFLNLIFDDIVSSKNEITKQLGCDPRTVVEIMDKLSKHFTEIQHKRQFFYYNKMLVEYFQLNQLISFDS